MTRATDRQSASRDEVGAVEREGSLTLGGQRNEGGTNHERIAARAYQRYLARGSESGHDLEDWLEAEQEVCEPPDR